MMLIRRMPPWFLPVPPRRGIALRPSLLMSCILLVFELSQGWQCLLEVRSMPDWHRIGTNCVWTNPPIGSVPSNFFWSQVVRMVFVRQFVHLATHFLRATSVKHVLAEFLVPNEPVVDTQVELILAFLLERVRDVVLVIPWLLSVTVPVGSPFLYVVVGNREEIHGVLDKFLVLLCSVSQEMPARAVDDANVPSMISIPCTVLWVPYRVTHTIRCSQLHESFVWILDWRD